MSRSAPTAPGGVTGFEPVTFGGDRLNPVLVKEVRQALRGKLFRVSFLVTLTLATLVAFLTVVIGTVSGRTDGLGPTLFVSMFVCLAAAVQVLVPISAFVSMGAEWEENTWDLLVLSSLRPRAILLGKLLGAAVQALLFFSAFGPFLVFAFLLRGLAPLPVFAALGFSALASLTLTSLALWLSSLTTQRFLRVVLLALLAGALVWSVGTSTLVASNIADDPYVLGSPQAHVLIVMALCVSALLSVFFFTAGCSRLAHPEENRSTGLRVLTTVTVLAAFGWLFWALPQIGARDPLYVGGLVLLGAMCVPLVLFLTEPPKLGRRVVHQVPRSRVLALLAAPFLPGGGRGMLFLLMNGALLYFGAALIGAWHSSVPLHGAPSAAHLGVAYPWSPGLSALLVGVLYAVAYIGLGAVCVARLTRTGKRRVLACALLYLGWIPIVVGPTAVGFFLGNFGGEVFFHPGNPFWLVPKVWSDGLSEERLSVSIVLGFALLAVVLQVPRMVRGIREVLAASRAARARRAESSGAGT